MKNWIDIRRWERPDRPQPNYKAILGNALWEAPLMAGILAASLNCSYRTPERPKLDVRTHTWINEPVYKATGNFWEAPLYVPIGDAQRSGVRTPDRAYDRTYLVQTAPAFSWVERVIEQTVSTWIPAFDAQRSGTRTAERARFDVLRQTETQPAWITANLIADATVAQRAAIWPLAQTFRTTERAKLDVRVHTTAPEPAWLPFAADTVIGTWAPAFNSELAGFRSTTRAVLDVRRQDTPTLVPQVPAAPDSTIAQRAGIWSQLANPGRTPARGGDVRRVDTAPAFSWQITVVTIPPTAFTGKVFTVSAHHRGMPVPGHDRAMTTTTHRRTFSVPARERTFTVPKRKRNS